MPDRDSVMKDFVRSMPMLRSFLFHLCRDWELVDEAVQEVAVWLCDHWSDFEGGRFGAWIRTVARYRFYEARKRRRGKELTVDDQLLAAVPDRLWDEEVPELAAPQLLESCLGRLNERQRRMLKLHYEEGHDASRLATVLDSSVSAIYMALHRLRKSLRDCIDLGQRQREHTA